MLPDGFSDYIAYADESGDPSLAGINIDFPLFALVFCIFPIDAYIRNIVPAVLRLKFDFFGHDQIVLHETDIRRRNPPFVLLGDERLREQFFERIRRLIEQTEMTVIAAVIDKQRLADMDEPGDPYALALQFCMERTQQFLKSRQQSEPTTRIVFESRGSPEDRRLQEVFEAVRVGGTPAGPMENLRHQFASKQVNSAGLQLADLAARPIALRVLRPTQSNRAYDAIQAKLLRSPDGRTDGWGLKTYP